MRAAPIIHRALIAGLIALCVACGRDFSVATSSADLQRLAQDVGTIRARGIRDADTGIRS